RNRSTLEGFLKRLRTRALPAATKDLATLTTMASQAGESLTRADVSFWERKAKEAALDLDFQELRNYFPLDKVWAGLQTLMLNWYGLRFKKMPSASVYHPSVEVYSVVDGDGKERSLLYLDLFTRREKQPGAWVNGLITTKKDQVGVVV